MDSLDTAASNFQRIAEDCKHANRENPFTPTTKSDHLPKQCSCCIPTLASHCHLEISKLPQAVRAITSIVNIALYAYATAVLGGMTMFPASDAVRLMVMFGANAGLGRIIGSYAILQDHDLKTTVVVDVAHWQIDELRKYIGAEVQVRRLAEDSDT